MADMMLQATLTDMQTHRVYHGSFLGGIAQGQNVVLNLDGPNHGYAFTIAKVRGWLSAADNDYLFYLFDVHGKRFKVRITQQVIDSKP